MLKTQISLNVSKYYFIFMMAILIMNAAIILWVPMQLSYKIGLFILNILYCSYILHRYVFLSAINSIKELSYDGETWCLQQNNRYYYANLSGESTVTRLVCILRFQEPSRWFKRTCMVWCDSLKSKDDYRRLIVFLKSMRL